MTDSPPLWKINLVDSSMFEKIPLPSYELSDRSDDLISLLDSQQAFHDEISLYLDFLRTFAEQSKLPFLHPNIHVALTSEDRVPEVVTKLAMLTDMVPPELLVPGGKSDPFVTLHVFPGAVRKDPVKGFLRMASRMEGWTVDLQTRNWEELAGKLGEGGQMDRVVDAFGRRSCMGIDFYPLLVGI